MRLSLKLLQSEFQKVIPRESKELVLKNTEVTRFWNLLDSFAREIRQEYVKKIPDGGTPSDNIVRAMAIGRIAALEEVLGEKPTQA